VSPYAYNQHFEGDKLSELVDSYQATGRYVLTREQALGALGVSDEALKKAVQRLVAKRRLAVLRRGFFVIVPMEYREAGAPPPSWFIDELMEFHGQLYYVGLLSAAALHGAAHQQPQEFQVITNEQLRPAVAGRARIRFFQKLHIERTPTIEMKTETGAMRVATPEATALDLLRYLEGAGHLGHVATVLGELAEKIEAERLAEVAKLEGELSNAQRLGHILDQVGAREVAAAPAAWISEQHPRFVPLRSDRSARRAATGDRTRAVGGPSRPAARPRRRRAADAGWTPGGAPVRSRAEATPDRDRMRMDARASLRRTRTPTRSGLGSPGLRRRGRPHERACRRGASPRRPAGSRARPASRIGPTADRQLPRARNVEQAFTGSEHGREILEAVERPERVRPSADLHGRRSAFHCAQRWDRGADASCEHGHGLVPRDSGRAQAAAEPCERGCRLGYGNHKVQYLILIDLLQTIVCIFMESSCRPARPGERPSCSYNPPTFTRACLPTTLPARAK